jgi:hypothetical protein
MKICLDTNDLPNKKVFVIAWKIRQPLVSQGSSLLLDKHQLANLGEPN